jgi:glutamate synthase (NADPH/NADH) small chain
MGNPRAFLTVVREKDGERTTAERVRDWREVTTGLSAAQTEVQASRCMDCGIPFCHQGCPLGNLIPEWNDLVYRGEHDEAARRLLETNNFPEVTGRVCPAPCEASCVLALEDAPVAIKSVERMLSERIRANGFAPQRPTRAPSGKTVAVIGSGPAGLATAQQLARLGHGVTVFERDDRIGGLLRYGIPDFKLEKGLLDERLAQLRGEGVRFETGVDVGVDVTSDTLLGDFDRVVLAGGAQKARGLTLEGAGLEGVHFAMNFLTQQNRRVAGDTDSARLGREISARGKAVVVLGGGDTGADCVGTSIRQGATSVLQLELMPRPPNARVSANPWPEWPLIFRSSTSHDEGAARDWAVSTRALVGTEGRVTALQAVRVTVEGKEVREVPGSALSIPCELVLLAMGFLGPETKGLVSQLGVALDPRGNVQTNALGETSVPRVYATGDMSRGQSLVVWAIADGRRVAAGVDAGLR